MISHLSIPGLGKLLTRFKSLLRPWSSSESGHWMSVLGDLAECPEVPESGAVRIDNRQERLAMARLFIPGPTDVDPEVLQAQVRPMVGHRSTAFEQLYARLQPRLREIFQTDHRVFVVASSGSGVWEGAMRSVVARKLLLCVCGAFGQRWADVAASNGTPFE